MPSRGFYQVSDKEEGQAAERDESYKSCVITLLIFFFLCIILILVGLPWKKYNTHHIKYSDDDLGTTQRHHHDSKHHAEKTTTTTESVKRYSNKDIFANKPETTTSELEHSESTRNFDTTDATISIDISSEFKELLNVETSTEQETSTFSIINEEFVTDKQLYQESSTSDINLSIEDDINATETNASSSSTETNTSNFAVETSTSSFVTKEYSEGTTNDSFSNLDIHTVQISTSTELNFIRETTTSNVYENTTGSVIGSTTESEENSTIKTTANYSFNTTIDSVTKSTMPSITTEGSTITTSEYKFDKKVCTTDECKTIASKMLFYMNHTVDPCDDFYEYACGGFEANPQTIDLDLEGAAHQRILRQSQKTHDPAATLFYNYYNSCMHYDDIDVSERIKLAKEVLDKIGKFHTTDSWARNRADFTELVAKLLLHNSAPLFDVTPDLEEYTPKQFTLKIGPTTYECPFDTGETEDPCYANQYKRDQEAVDLWKLYKEYKTCKKNPKKFIKSITEALTALGVFHELGNAYNITQYLETLVISIDFEIVQTFFANYPSKDQIREAYLTKNYTRVTIATLQEKANVINWTGLIYALTKEKILPEAHVQVYFYDVLIQGLRSLKEFEAADAMQLNNILLGLYAHNLYQKLVSPKHRNSKAHCLRIAANMLFPEASSLYISSFSSDELLHMSETIHGLFGKLKETLKLKIEETEWTEEVRDALVAKINDLRVTVPDVVDRPSTHRTIRAKQLDLSDNYFKNSVTLMRKYRELIYSELFTDLSHSEQIWTQYATPFQSKGLAIYGLNLVVIPFGVIDWSTKYNESLFDYIILATLGNAIAHQIAHHFDANGIYYWNGTRNADYFPSNSDTANSNFEDYIHCQKNVLYGSPITMTLPSTRQTVSYKITQLTLNERLSETMGLRLAYDTLDRLRSREEVRLLWLELDPDQLFYLTYAQVHCTKTPLTSSYISLYEDEQLPSRIRIFVSASNNRLLGEAWKCPEGSGIIPSYTCSVFPYLHSSDTTTVTMMRK